MKSIKNILNEGAAEVAAAFEKFDTEKCADLIRRALDIEPADVTVRKDDQWLPCADILVTYDLEKDWPHKLSVNACRFVFQYDFRDKSLTLHRNPHVNLSPYDREHDFKYFAMRSVDSLAKECGVPTFRKCRPSDEKGMADKITKYLNAVVPILDTYTDGYPYHESTLTVSIKDAYKK